jgi:MFS transporter, MHS family, shikimate and dehydroshikimate transport protein
LSILLVGVGLFIRLRVEESPAFEQARASEEGASRMPILDVLRNHPKNVLLAMGARLGDNVLFYVFSVFVLTYVAEQLGLPEGIALSGVLIAASIEVFTIPAFGALSDGIGRRPVYIGGAVFCALLAFPYFWLLNSGSTVLIWLAIVLSLPIGHAAMYAPQRASSPSSSARASATAGPASATN